MAATTIYPPTNYTFNSPQISVDIYPQSGGKYTISGGNAGILQAVIKKNIRDDRGGTFSLLLAPGGPNGVNDPNSWTNIINMNSLITIFLGRGSSKRIVMAGIVNEIEEDQVWDNNPVKRVTKIYGLDFTYFFNSFSFYSLTFLGLITTALPFGAAGYLLGLWNKQFQGPPNEVAFEYMQYIMLGVGNPTKPAVLDNTYIYYKGNKLFLRQIFGYWFEHFDSFVPFLADLVNSEGNWMDKFTSFLPWPYYEFFVTTAETQDYPVFASATPTSGIPSTLPPSTIVSTSDEVGTPTNTFADDNNISNVFPAIIGRINPLPWVEYPDTPYYALPGTLPPTSVVPAASGAPSLLPPTVITTTSPPSILPPVSIVSSVVGNPSPNVNLHSTRWDALNIYSLGAYSFIDSKVGYDTSEVFNFFAVQTTDSSQIAANFGGNPLSFSFEMFGGIIDFYSINTFGYKPKWIDLRWLTVFGSLGASVTDQQTLMTNLLGQLASYYIPSANMLKGSVSFPMWPDVLPGNRFIYSPFKGGLNPYMFYIEGVTHTYNFGAMSYTTLDLSRGLLQSIYNDPTELAGILLDTQIRKDGTFTLRSDINTNISAYHITPSNVTSRSSIANFPWAAAPPNVTIIAKNYPAGTTTAYDPYFIAAAAGTTCGSTSQITPELLKAIAYQESGVNNSNNNLNPNHDGVNYYGTMQVASNAGYNNSELQSNPQYNINAGAQILCNKLQSTGNNLYQALALYGGVTGGFNTPAGMSYVYSVLSYANNSSTLTG